MHATTMHLHTQRLASPIDACNHSNIFHESLGEAQRQQKLLNPAVLDCEEGHT
jgi:hypothetical protein